MKNLHWAAALATSILSASPSAFASSYTHDSLLAPEDDSSLFDYQPGALYGGASVGYASMGDRSLSVGCNSEACDGPSWKGYVGYQITDSVAAEATYHNLGHFEYHSTAYTVNSDPTAISLSTTVKTKLNDDINVFGRAGFMAWDANAEFVTAGNSPTTTTKLTHNGTDLLIGAGADYKINNNLSIRGEYEHIGGDLNMHNFSVGAKYSTL